MWPQPQQNFLPPHAGPPGGGGGGRAAAPHPAAPAPIFNPHVPPPTFHHQQPQQQQQQLPPQQQQQQPQITVLSRPAALRGPSVMNGGGLGGDAPSLQQPHNTFPQSPSSDLTWEDMYDSGELDTQINALSLGCGGGGGQPFVPAAAAAAPRQLYDPKSHPSSTHRNFPRAAASAAASPSFQTVQVQVQSDDAGQPHRTLYRPNEPKLKILKRGDGAPSNGGQAGAKTKQPTKSLKQREAEYAAARQRILGSSAAAGDAAAGQPSGAGGPVISKKERGNSVAAGGGVQAAAGGGAAVRAPKGPDGSKGFKTNKR